MLYFSDFLSLSSCWPFNDYNTPVQAKDAQVTFCSKDELRKKPPVSDLVFGKHFTDHMLEVEWDVKKGWGKPVISPFHNLNLHPAAKVLHYSTEVSKDCDVKLLLLLVYYYIKVYYYIYKSVLLY